MLWAKCKILVLAVPTAQLPDRSIFVVSSHRRYNNPFFLKNPIPLLAGYKSADSRTLFNELSLSCKIFNVSLSILYHHMLLLQLV